MSVAAPGHGDTAASWVGGTTVMTVCTRPSARAVSPRAQAASTRLRVLVRISATSPPSSTPAVIHSGVMPGPPGCSSSTCQEVSPASVGPGRPGSSSSSAGWRATWPDQGSSSATGTSRKTASRPQAAGPRTTRTAARIPSTTATSHTAGTNAAAAASSRAPPQAVRHRSGTRTPTRTSGGSSTASMAVPSRPAAMAPVTAGSSA